MRSKPAAGNQIVVVMTLMVSFSMATLLSNGCATRKMADSEDVNVATELLDIKDSYLEESDALDQLQPFLDSVSPLELVDYTQVEYQAMTLQQCIEQALSNTQVIRELGVNIVRSPGLSRTAYDPATVFSDPRFGEEAALSQFDANIGSSTIFQKNDRAFNNPFSGDAQGVFQQDFLSHIFEVNKLTANGTSFAIRNNLDYDSNNNLGNRFSSTWQNTLESEFRHPLLQGSGALFNRIAGPSQQPGAYNGVLIARTNTEISVTRFEIGVRDLISNVENAYWDLYYAYRELEAQIAARDKAFELYKNAKAKKGSSNALDRNGAREQYLRFENNVVNSLEGRVLDGTQVDSGSSGGSFRATGGVRVAERRLRYLLGMPITDGKTILKPSDSPMAADLLFDWNQSVQSALTHRPERRQQQWVIKQRELEVAASKNFLLPRLDLVGTYRFRGLGDDLTGGNSWNDFLSNPALTPSADQDFRSLDYQEWQLGAEMRLPVGFRAAHSGVRNAELRLQRARGIQREQDRAIVLGLSNAIAEMRRAKAAAQVAKERLEAATEYKKSAEGLRDLGQLNINVLLEAERRVLEATLQSVRAETEYAIAVKNVHFEKGTLLEFNNVYLQESASEPGAYRQAELNFQNRKRKMSYVLKNPAIGQPQNRGLGPILESPRNGVPIVPADQLIEPAPEQIPLLENPESQVPLSQNKPGFSTANAESKDVSGQLTKGQVSAAASEMLPASNANPLIPIVSRRPAQSLPPDTEEDGSDR